MRLITSWHVADGAKLSLALVRGFMDVMPSVSESSGGEMTRLPLEFFEPRWYAAYTCAKHEKRVAEQFSQRALENLLPQYESVRRWKDRRVKLQLPLFPGYVFVRLALRDHLRVLETPSVVRLVGFNGRPTALPDKEIEALRVCVAAQLHTEPHSYLTAGRRVRIKSGPLAEWASRGGVSGLDRALSGSGSGCGRNRTHSIERLWRQASRNLRAVFRGNCEQQR
jgi:transcription antitermination factor NusG